MLALKRIRLQCRLRQVDVWAGTGISVGRLSAAERGRTQLTEPETTLLVSYLREKLKAIQDSESHVTNQSGLNTGGNSNG
jgi:hypothetical protein